jgi:hypothetical protein
MSGLIAINGISPAGEVPFAQGNAVEFNGVDSYYDARDGSVINWDCFTQPISFVFWIKLGADGTVLFNRRGPTSPNPGWTLNHFSGAGGLVCQNLDSSGNGLVVAGGNLSTTTWTHVAFCFDGTGAASGVTIYYDGVLRPNNVLQNNLAGSTVNPTEVFRIGADNLSGPTNASSARYSYFYAYRRVLTPSEVLNDYNAGTPTDPRQQSWYNPADMDLLIIPGNVVGDSSTLINGIGPNLHKLDGFNGPAIVVDSP